MGVIILLFVAVLLYMCCRRKKNHEGGVCFRFDRNVFHIHSVDSVHFGKKVTIQTAAQGNPSEPSEQPEIVPLMEIISEPSDPNLESETLSKEPNVPSLRIKVPKKLYTEVVTSTLKIEVTISGDVHEVIWYFNEEMVDLTNITKYSIENISQPSLTVMNLDRSDNGSYYCEAIDEKENKVQSDSIRVKVKEPVVKVSKFSVDVDKGNKTTIECTITNKPRDCNITWLKILISDKNMKEELKTSKNKDAKYQDSNVDFPHLTILDAQESDEAYYRVCLKYCTSAGERTVESENPTRLHVHEAKKGVVNIAKNFDVRSNHIGHVIMGSQDVTLQKGENPEDGKPKISGSKEKDDNDDGDRDDDDEEEEEGEEEEEEEEGEGNEEESTKSSEDGNKFHKGIHNGDTSNNSSAGQNKGEMRDNDIVDINKEMKLNLKIQTATSGTWGKEQVNFESVV
ncbi:YTH domain-containing protein 1-like isoform X2 [Mytilus californianus]|uniref:YTH domain-containing protein 1-like isoform X2 n=1 Tax=Mytilus californianus TaxID=6549 RepID=UPI0022458261|nr:YTH domain-containing protein 1-like isoform X2 [Mytilus californianus]